MKLIKIQEDGLTYGLDKETSKKIAEFERTLKSIKEQEDLLKKAILEEMEVNDILKLETDDLVVSYVGSSDRETFDSKTFRVKHQELYDEYVKISPVKPSIRIKVKDE